MALLEWNDSLSVGFAEIDNDHKQLIGIINQLDNAASANLETEVIEEIFAELLSYTVWHFRHEERLMQTHGDPTFFEHKQEHDGLTAAALARQKEFLDGNPDAVENLMQFLNKWLIQHILETDMKTGHFLADNSN